METTDSVNVLHPRVRQHRWLVSLAIFALVVGTNLYHGVFSSRSVLRQINPIVNEPPHDLPLQEAEENSMQEHEPLNIVLFYADDWTARTLGAVNPIVKTPNIDEMGRRGVIFKHNCVTSSICWVSRATMNTGLYLSQHQQWKISSDNMFNKTVSWPDTLFPLLRRHGVFTGFVGKWHHPAPKQHMEYTFDYHKMYWGKHWYDGVHVTKQNELDALQFLKERPKNKTFALAVSFFATHALDGEPYPNNYQPQNASMQLYVNDTIPLPRTSTKQHWEKLPWFFGEGNAGRGRWRKNYRDERYQVSMKNYYRMATEVDASCGRVIGELKRQGVYNNTLIIFTTDNGNIHGQHQLAEKWLAFEESIRVPLVIQDPRMPKSQRGTINNEFTLSVDLAPTILSAAKIPVPSFMQGGDMAQLYLNPQETAKSWRKDFFYEFRNAEPEQEMTENAFFTPSVLALIQKDYKYISFPQFKYEQLFHVKEDPWEEHDIINTTATTNVEVLQTLRARYLHLKNRAQSGKPV